MTQDQLQAIRDDLAFMRSLAEEGRRAPLLGGSILMAAGLSFAPVSVAHWAFLRGFLGDNPWLPSIIWTAAMAVFLVVLFQMNARLRGRVGVHAAANRAMGAAWGGAGFAMFALFGAFILASYVTQEWIIMALYGPVILAFYGAAWSVAAAMSDRSWLKTVAGGALLASIAVAGLAGRADQYLAYAAALLLTVALPGWALMRQAPAEVV